MSELRDGGPAFPVMVRLKSEDREVADVDVEVDDGMSLRDYFAAKAISGGARFSGPEDESFARVIAAKAYRLADAMLEERERRRG